MQKVLMAAASAAVMALACPERAPAQQGGAGEWWDWALPGVAGGQQITVSRGGVILLPAPRKEPERRAPGRDDSWGNDRRGDERWGYERETKGKSKKKSNGKNGGPPFCQNGKGHPVHGWRWCVEKGYGHRDRRWERVRWERVTLRRPRQYNSVDVLRRESLVDILGSVVFGRIEARGRTLAGGTPIVGRWTPAQGYRDGGVLQLRAGNLPIAELTDLDGDGIADVILLLNN